MTKNMKGFIKYVDSMTAEHVEADGCITCEFSCDGTELKKKKAFLDSIKLEHGRKWTIGKCDTCKGYDEKSHYHVMID